MANDVERSLGYWVALTRTINPLGSKAYFCPAGGAGIWKFAVLANSSKVCGRRWFCISHPRSARLSNWSCVRPVLAELDGPGGGGGPVGTGVVDVTIGSAIGAPVGPVVGVAAEDVELESCDGATETGVLSDFPHPPPAARMQKRQRIPTVGFQPTSQPKSKNAFTRFTYMDVVENSPS